MISPDAVHPPGRALRPDQRDRQLGDRGGLPPDRRLARRRACACASPINLSVHQLRHLDLADRIAAALRRHQHQPAAADLRDHRVGGDGRRLERHAAWSSSWPPGRQHLDRRLRHRLLEPVVPAQAARRRAEDRPQLRARPGDQRRRARRRRRRRQAGPGARPEGGRRGRRDRGAAPDPALASAATSCRASCSPGR